MANQLIKESDMQNENLTRQEQRLMRHWFSKVDENTIELKEKRWAPVKIVLCFILIVSVYYDFINPNYKKDTLRYIELSFQTEKWLERGFQRDISEDNPKLNRWGQTKAQYINDALEWLYTQHKWELAVGYFIVGKYLFILLICLYPTQRRVRFDRKRQIVYTYLGKKLYITEVNKLMRPFPEYIINTGGAILFWVHPYQYTPLLRRMRHGSQMMVMDYTMWLPMFSLFFSKTLFKKSKAALLKAVLVDFMNPDTPQERIDSIIASLNTQRSLREWVVEILFGWFDGGLYCRRLPKQDVLEKAIAHYFSEDAPHILALPSCYQPADYKVWSLDYAFLMINSVEKNRGMGFDAPCPDLYEYPKYSQHYSVKLGGWGNQKELAPQPELKKGKKKKKFP